LSNLEVLVKKFGSQLVVYGWSASFILIYINLPAMQLAVNETALYHWFMASWI
ncbi:hypothetical protein AAULR_17284, partial [Lacticaseibacillus rhamnosus MTCC 5462]